MDDDRMTRTELRIQRKGYIIKKIICAFYSLMR